MNSFFEIPSDVGVLNCIVKSYCVYGAKLF